MAIRQVDWVEKNETMDELLNQEAALTTFSMNQGFEAEVMKISSGKESFVLKIWNKTSKPDIRFQYRLLNVLYERGVSVTKPVGWGINPQGDQVLLTSYGGTPVRKLNDKKMVEMANLLSKIHQVPVAEIGNLHLPNYDFIEYFYPGVREHTDLFHALTSLVHIEPIKLSRIIHGDFHLGNLVEDHDRYTVIDWTNGQLGDPRFDFAWALVLIRIYTSDRNAQVFHSAYLRENTIQQEELDVFEALACLRWILLNRLGGVPKGPRTMAKVKRLFLSNRFLNDLNQASLQKG